MLEFCGLSGVVGQLRATRVGRASASLVMASLTAVSFLAAALAVMTSRAQAAGGAHIVDDSEVETPGECHYEFWVTRFVPGDGYGNFSPACTPSVLPNLEIGAALQHYWDQTVNAPLLGPTIKLNVRPASTGLGVAVEYNAGINLKTGDLGYALAIIPVTIPLFDDKVRINLNAGWNYIAGINNAHALFYGAQVEAKIGFDLSLMLETFGRSQGSTGAQVGLRYTPRRWLDFDFLAGGFFDNISARFLTVGVTIRH